MFLDFGADDVTVASSVCTSIIEDKAHCLHTYFSLLLRITSLPIYRFLIYSLSCSPASAPRHATRTTVIIYLVLSPITQITVPSRSKHMLLPCMRSLRGSSIGVFFVPHIQANIVIFWNWRPEIFRGRIPSFLCMVAGAECARPDQPSLLVKLGPVHQALFRHHTSSNIGNGHFVVAQQ